MSEYKKAIFFRRYGFLNINDNLLSMLYIVEYTRQSFLNSDDPCLESQVSLDYIDP